MKRVAAGERTTREVWLAVARAAADHRRIRGAVDRVFYDDLTLRRTGDGYAWEQRQRAIARGLEARVGDDELVNALLSWDPQLGPGGALKLVDWERRREGRLTDVHGQLLCDLGERD